MRLDLELLMSTPKQYQPQRQSICPLTTQKAFFPETSGQQSPSHESTIASIKCQSPCERAIARLDRNLPRRLDRFAPSRRTIASSRELFRRAPLAKNTDSSCPEESNPKEVPTVGWKDFFRLALRKMTSFC
nr:uncharacterized protein LOC123765450 [Procambarus clarkii]